VGRTASAISSGMQLLGDPLCCGAASLSQHVLSKLPGLIEESQVTPHQFRDDGAVRLEALPGTIDPSETFLGEPDGCLDKCRDFLRKSHRRKREDAAEFAAICLGRL